LQHQKYGLRHPLAVSDISEFIDKSKFESVLDDTGVGLTNGLNKDNSKIKKNCIL